MSNDLSCMLTFEHLEMLVDQIISHKCIWSDGKQNLAQECRTLCGGHLLDGPDYEVDTKNTYHLSGVPLESDSLVKQIPVCGRHFSKTTNHAR